MLCQTYKIKLFLTRYISSEFEEFESYFKKSKVYRFVPSNEMKEKYKDGGIAIIDQWIVAHARYKQWI